MRHAGERRWQEHDFETAATGPPPREQGRPGGRYTIGDLLRSLRDEILTLLRQEVALARVEMTEKGSRVGRNIAFLAVGATIAVMGVVFLLISAMFGLVIALREMGLTTENALWVAPLVIGAVVAIAGYIFVQKGISTLRRESATPGRTAKSLREDKQWLQEKVRSS